MPYNIYEQWNAREGYTKFDFTATFYEVNITWASLRPNEDIWDIGPKGLETRILRKAEPDCKGETITRVCFFNPSRMEYKLFMDKGSNVTFQSSDWKSDVVVENMYVPRSPSLFHARSALLLPYQLTSLRLATSSARNTKLSPSFHSCPVPFSPHSATPRTLCYLFITSSNPNSKPGQCFTKASATTTCRILAWAAISTTGSQPPGRSAVGARGKIHSTIS